MRLRKANASDKVDDLAKAVKVKANKVIDGAHEVASAATVKARHGVHFAGEKLAHTGERITDAGETVTHAGEKLMKMSE